MDDAIILLRIVHIGAGVFWAGTIFFFVTLLEPSIREAGPDGARVMQALLRRRYQTLMPILALLTILSGVDLLRRASAGFAAAWFRTPTGLTLTLGSAAAVIAFVLGVVVMRPAATRILALAPSINSADAAARDAAQAELGALRGRVTTTARLVALLLAASVITMAIARYLG